MQQFVRRSLALWILATALAGLGVPGTALANHPVLVEGNNCADGGPGVTLVVPGTCGDFDGDGRIGTAEDTDNATDRIFGTIGAALAAANNGANQNGRVTVVTSGRFAEVVSITGANGNVTLEAAPGVEANIDAVLSGDPGNAARQAAPGIVVNAPADRYVTIRNIVSRNWTVGIQVSGSSHVTIEDSRLENNVNYGILVSDSARVAIVGSTVSATGFRAGATGNFPTANAPDPGIGIEFEDSSSGLIADTTVTGSFAAGISNETGTGSSVRLRNVNLFDNNPDRSGGFGFSSGFGK
jgi:parallel beta-helix repeat protein